jgi:hypothetical protein
MTRGYIYENDFFLYVQIFIVVSVIIILLTPVLLIFILKCVHVLPQSHLPDQY